MKKIIITILAALIISLFGLNHAMNFAFAQDAPAQDPAQDPAVADTCLVGMKKYFDGEDGESGANKSFRDDIEANFKNKSANSSLLGLSVQRYERYKLDAAAEYAKFAPQTGNSQEAEYSEQNQCYYEIQKQIQDARKIIINDIKITTYKKKQTILIEKYDSISEKMRKFNVSLAELKAFFMTFKDKIPGFIKTCI
ncbi:MAG: hypothetical protein US89_C0011G0017 [Candidatus Peregrinibacteria bacterium GW2011_GWF2_38_29]|nr:MAG: hypothetical protein US89_C0011G0017 [Candidatus Peregrinibacteria bacterium GW2011_GWF2_38_29]HBB02321.1 hypothetical protein [Candidatus Peregrinibacteria bacterium]